MKMWWVVNILYLLLISPKKLEGGNFSVLFAMIIMAGRF